ncbi:MAG: phosphate ABC transporter permease PstA [Planctomycetota bacterium]
MTIAAPRTKQSSGADPVRRPLRRRTSLLANGEPMVWLTGGTLVVSLVMIAGLLGTVIWFGVGTFWPAPLTELNTVDGRRLLGEVTGAESFEPSADVLSRLPDAVRDQRTALVEERGGTAERRLLRTGNFELSGKHFEWVSDFEVDGETAPEWGVVVERMTWGRFYGYPTAFRIDGEDVASTPEDAWAKFQEYHDVSRDRYEERLSIDVHEIGAVNRRGENARLRLRDVELEHGVDSDAWRTENERYLEVEGEVASEFEELSRKRNELMDENKRYELVLTTSSGDEAPLVVADIVRAYPANQLGFFEKVGVYLSRWWEFLSERPRESNSEGGVLPAIFGTVAMTMIMSIIVVPFGVLAALYLREYAKQGLVVSAVRIAVNNLAGVPSIVFGVFGLGFFCYIIGDRIDHVFFASKLPDPTFGTGGLMWASLTLALLTLPVVIVATEEALSAVPASMREGSYACGATKWQTIKKIVLPRAAPGIMTGMILAIARGAGEVAPLMLVGVVKHAPELAVDGVFPYIHAQRSFMHLGFHIYDVGFQSQNSEAAKPMVFTTTLLLITLIVVLNLLAIWIRARLRRRFQGAAI